MRFWANALSLPPTKATANPMATTVCCLALLASGCTSLMTDSPFYVVVVRVGSAMLYGPRHPAQPQNVPFYRKTSRFSQVGLTDADSGQPPVRSTAAHMLPELTVAAGRDAGS